MTLPSRAEAELEAGAKILVAASRPIGELLRAMLLLGGYQVMEGRSGEEALALVERESPGLLILDSQLPGLSSYDVCARLRGNPADSWIPILLLRRGWELGGRFQALESGADESLYLPPNRRELMARVRSLVRSRRWSADLLEVERVLLALAVGIESRDPFAAGHTERVSHYALSLGRALGSSPQELRHLRRGAILHDAGKLTVPGRVLMKVEPLSAEEWERIREHPVAGERICQPLGQGREVLDIVRYHHERLDGTGYPEGLAGEAIPLGARIMAIADAYDALTSDRPYRKKLSSAEALQALQKGAGKQFEPPLVALFTSLVQQNKV